MSKRRSRKKESSVWVHVGNCPICGDGLRRLRCYESEDGARVIFVLCDECEAMWFDTRLDDPPQFADSEDRECPISGDALFGPQSRWATIDDLQGTVWENLAIIDWN